MSQLLVMHQVRTLFQAMRFSHNITFITLEVKLSYHYLTNKEMETEKL